jgi:SOS-response transcriptional repressor LexA
MSYLTAMKRTQAQRFGIFLGAIIRRVGWTHDEFERRDGPAREVVGRHLRAIEDPKGERIPSEIFKSTRAKYAQAFKMDPDAFERLWFTAEKAIEDGNTNLMEIMASQVAASVQGVLNDGLPPGSDFDPRQLADYKRSGWIPEIGAVPAGSFLDTDIKLLADRALPPSLYPYPEEYPAIIRARGDSMAPLINDGDAVVIARKFWREPKSGDIVVVTRAQDDDHTIKRLDILDDGSWQLIPRNPDHAPTTVKRDRIRAAAVVVGWYRPHYLSLGRPPKKH